MDFGLAPRFGTFILAAAVLFAAIRIHRHSGKHTKWTKPLGCVAAFLAGCSFLITFVGSWVSGLAATGGVVGVAGLIVCSVIIFVDWGLDRKPDKPAFWASFALAMFIVFGIAQIPTAGNQIGTGTHQVTDQISRVQGGGNVTAPGKPGAVTVRK